jgi:triacylglycerol esterase/lipase EstA (alpha/beta hydrolase family)
MTGFSFKFQNIAKESYAAHDAVLVGHSMGGVISRLLVSNADEIWQSFELKTLTNDWIFF